TAGIDRRFDHLWRFVDEDPDPLDRVRDIAHQLPALLDVDVPFAGPEDEPKQVDAELDREVDVLRPRVPADLDLRHGPLSSRSLASRSAARSSESPTSAASTLRRASASVSSRL